MKVYLVLVLLHDKDIVLLDDNIMPSGMLLRLSDEFSKRLIVKVHVIKHCSTYVRRVKV